MSLEQYKNASRKELWEILQIQMQVLQAESSKVAELELEKEMLIKSHNMWKEQWWELNQSLPIRYLEQQAKTILFALKNITNPDIIYNQGEAILSKIKKLK
jgi:hypothetical protein